MGQDHVTKTLQNAIRLGKVSHAYLFCGTRGTGKTTTARLLAKALNCQDGPTQTPCNKCHACISITEGSAMDIVEMDAASHRGIGDIKDINENVKYPPMDFRYKVFIIDEAHQLSNDAKDAFLKTLEEPPAHAVFILATTEPQSIPITIRSRCQQFDFRRGSLKDIHKRLKFVTDSEGVKAQDAALDLIAVNADGSWRDSLSLLEQVLAYTESEVTTDDVNAVLGTVNQDFLFNLVDTVADGSEIGAFDAAAQAMDSGKDVQLLLRSIAQHFRNLLFASVTKNLGDIAPNDEVASRFRVQASKFNKPALLHAVELFTESEHDARYSDHHRLLLELALLKTIQASKPVQQISAPASAPVVKQEAVPVVEPERVRPTFQRPAPPKHEPSPTPAPSPKPTTTSPAAVSTPSPKVENTTASNQQKLPEFDRIKEKWNLVLQHIKSKSPVAYGLLKDAKPAAVRNGALVLYFQGEGQKNILENENTSAKYSKKGALLKGLEMVFGVANASIICEVEQSAPAPVPSTPAPELQNQIEESGQDTLKDVLDIFPNSEIVD